MNKEIREDYLPLHEAARVYNYTRDHLGYLIRKGDLKGRKLGSFYFTTHRWMKDYLLKSGKAREKEMRIKQSKGQVRSSKYEGRSMKYEGRRRKLGKRKFDELASDFKKEFLPLGKDLLGALNKTQKAAKSFADAFRDGLDNSLTFLKELEGEAKGWQQEVKYLIKRLKNRTIKSRALESGINLISEGTNLFFSLPRKFILELRKNLIEVKRLLKKSLITFHDILRKVEREVLWKISYQRMTAPDIALRSQGGRGYEGRRRKCEGRRRKYEGRRRKLLALGTKADFRLQSSKFIPLLLIFLGIIVSSFGLYVIFPDSYHIAPLINNNIDNLRGALERASEPVYGLLADSGRLTQISKRFSQISKKISQAIADIDYVYVRYDDFKEKLRSDGERRRQRVEEKFKEFVLKTKTRLSLLKSDFNKIHEQFSHLAIKPSMSRFNLDMVKRVFLDSQNDINRQLIAFETGTDIALDSISHLMLNEIKDLERFFTKAQNDLYAWQSSTNRRLTEIENRFNKIKSHALAEIDRGTEEQLAQLRISFDFVIKPFSKLKNFIASRFGAYERIEALEKKVTKLEAEPLAPHVARQDKEGPVLSGAEGLVVIPSTEKDEENKEKIKAAFSDEVVVEPDKTGKSGIIRPIFRKLTEQQYLYLLVPINQ